MAAATIAFGEPAERGHARREAGQTPAGWYTVQAVLSAGTQGIPVTTSGSSSADVKLELTPVPVSTPTPAGAAGGLALLGLRRGIACIRRV